MAGYIKELLLDYSLNRLSLDVRSDLTIAVQSALLSGAYTKQEIKYLDLYLQGYTAQEIAHQYATTTDVIETTLARLFETIEELSGYTDTTLTNKVQTTKKYRVSGISKLKNFLDIHGKQFMTHSL